jgi:predicted ATP-grasp superfamily ATP-dependent carboligase
MSAAATSRRVRSPDPGRTSPAPAGALVTGADYRALGVIRSLGRRGIPVRVLIEDAEPLASMSRYATSSTRWPAGCDRVDFLCELARSDGLEGWALIPTADETAALVARNHAALARWFTHTLPAWDTVRWAYDKRLTYRLAERLGIAVPRTAWPGALAACETLELDFPAVLKPAIKESFNRLTAAKAWRVDDRAELLARYAEACTLVDPSVLMVQELVPGDGGAQFSFAALCADGDPLASLTARRTRQYPADFGRASTFVESVDCADVVEPSLRFLRETRFTGLVELEFKRDGRDGVLKLLDVNPRVWGWHTLCARAGVDFPYLLWLLVSGRPVPEIRARPGVSWLRLTTDTPTALREIAARRLPLREYARTLRRPRESAIFAWDDPLPGISEVPLLAYVLGRRLLRGGAV